jgi:hypothetical protein
MQTMTLCAELAARLRAMAGDLYSSEGETMKRWDQIRRQVETLKGSDLPRLNFEGLLEEFADLFSEAAEALDPSTLHNLADGEPAPEKDKYSADPRKW